jgi:hypothetical protein
MKNARFQKESTQSAELLIFHKISVKMVCPADLLTNQAVLKQMVHCHTARAPPVGIKPMSLAKAVALQTAPQIPSCYIGIPLFQQQGLDTVLVVHVRVEPSLRASLSDSVTTCSGAA